jgi:AmmeMemoRadiSam system protein B
MIRPPAAAGKFYPADAAEVEAELDRLIQPGSPRRDCVAVVVPHAGWMYSGATAGKVYSTVEIPDRVFLVGPNHHGIGSMYAVYDAGSWKTPLGDVPIAEPLAAELLDHCELLAEDPKAHRMEHSLEVQVPMLLHMNPKVQIVPVLIGGNWPEAGGCAELRLIGQAIAETVCGCRQPVLLVASTDLNHYEDQETSHAKDKRVLDAVLNLDEHSLMQRVKDARVSMCGVAATYAILVAAKELGADKAELIDYRTSGDVTGDLSAVVGYGGVVLS